MREVDDRFKSRSPKKAGSLGVRFGVLSSNLQCTDLGHEPLSRVSIEHPEPLSTRIKSTVPDDGSTNLGERRSRWHPDHGGTQPDAAPRNGHGEWCDAGELDGGLLVK